VGRRCERFSESPKSALPFKALPQKMLKKWFENRGESRKFNGLIESMRRKAGHDRQSIGTNRAQIGANRAMTGAGRIGWACGAASEAAA